MTSDFRKRSYGKKGSTINLKVLGATASLPYGLQAYGRDCVGDKANQSKEGYFAYLAAPLKKRALFIHEEGSGGDVVFHAWESSATNDAPPGRLALDKKKALTPKAVEKKIDAMQRAITTESRRNIFSQTVLKGKWSGYVECPSGRTILTRDIASFATMALVSDPSKRKWQWAVHIKDLKTTHWFTSPVAKAGSKGVQSVSLTGSRGTMAAAFNDAMKKLFAIVAKAATVKETVRRAAVDVEYRKKRRAKGQTSSPLTKTEKKAYKAAKAKIKTKAAGRISKKTASLQTKAAKVKAKAKTKADRIKAKAREKRARTRERATTKAKKAKKATTGRAARTTPLGNQSGLKGKYVTFTAKAGEQLKGKVGYVEKIGPNGRKNYGPKDGGAKLYVIAIGTTGGIANKLKTGVLEYKDGTRVFKVKGAAAFKKNMKAYAKAKGNKRAVDAISKIYGGPTPTALLGKRIVAAAKGSSSSSILAARSSTKKAKPKNGRRKAKTSGNGNGKPAKPPSPAGVVGNGRRKKPPAPVVVEAVVEEAEFAFPSG